MTKQLKVGDSAPMFSLTDQHGEAHSLEQALTAGPVVLLFYPYDQSPNCKRRLCALNVLRDEYRSQGIGVFGINNAGQESHELFSRTSELTMPLLSDVEFAVARSYSALFDIGPIKVIRTTIVAISSSGHVTYLRHGEIPSNKELIKIIRNAEAKAV